jgi:hypothetical protein
MVVAKKVKMKRRFLLFEFMRKAQYGGFKFFHDFKLNLGTLNSFYAHEIHEIRPKIKNLNIIVPLHS